MNALLLLMLLGADTPLSAVLIEGEGWRKSDEKEIHLSGSPYQSRKLAAGGYGVFLGGEKPLAVAPAGETWGATAVSPGRGKLVVAVPSHHHLWVFRINADGSLDARERCFTLRREKPSRGGSNVGEMAFDTKGRLWVAMPEGVQFFDEEMRFSGQLSRPTREPVTSVWFEGNTLFIECGRDVWKRKVNATGAE
jgi:ligand-binding sensor domain-containing protein